MRVFFIIRPGTFSSSMNPRKFAQLVYSWNCLVWTTRKSRWNYYQSFLFPFSNDVCNLISPAKWQVIFCFMNEKSLHETCWWELRTARARTYRMRSQGACFAYFILSMNNLLLQLTLFDSVQRSGDLSSSLDFECHNLSRDLDMQFTLAHIFMWCFLRLQKRSFRYQHRKCWMNWQVNDLFAFCTFWRSWEAKQKKKVFHKLCRRFSARNVETSISGDRQREKKCRAVMAENRHNWQTSSPRRMSQRCCNLSWQKKLKKRR